MPIILTSAISSSASLDIGIVRRSITEVAPEAITFEPTNFVGFDATGPSGGETYDDRFHDIEFFWDFYSAGTDNSYTFGAPVNVYSGAARHANGHKNSRYSYGAWPTHTYRTPGTYTVSVFAVEISSGKTATGTLQVTIGDPDTYFAGTNTIFLSPGGTFTNAPAGAQQVTSGDIDAAIGTYVDAQTTPKRIMLNDDEAYTFGGRQLAHSAAFPHFHLVRTFTGSKPTVAQSGSFDFNDKFSNQGDQRDLVIQGLDATGGYDSANATGAQISFYGTLGNSPNLTLIDNCDLDGFYLSLYESGFDGNVSHRASVFNDTSVTNWGQCAYLSDVESGIGGKVHAFVGTRFSALPTSLVDATGNGGWAVRIGSVEHIVMTHGDYFTNQGWSGGPSGTITIAVQQCFRLNYSALEGCKMNLSANSFEGGFGIGNFNEQTAAASKPVNGIVQMNYFLGTYQGGNAFTTQFGGVTVRSNIAVYPDRAGNENVGISTFFDFDNGFVNDADSRAAPVQCYNNTCVTLLEAADYDGSVPAIASFDSFDTTEEANNILHAPNATSPSTAYAPLGDDTNFFTPRCLGYETSSVNRKSTTATDTSAHKIDLFDPEAGSSAIGDYTAGKRSAFDFFGVQRSTVLAGLTRTAPSRGAIEPALES